MLGPDACCLCGYQESARVYRPNSTSEGRGPHCPSACARCVTGVSKVEMAINSMRATERDCCIIKRKIKETVDKMKRQPTEWGKIFANDMTGKGLMSTIYKQLRQLSIKKPHKQSN